jgi:hypothetical protein
MGSSTRITRAVRRVNIRLSVNNGYLAGSTVTVYSSLLQRKVRWREKVAIGDGLRPPQSGGQRRRRKCLKRLQFFSSPDLMFQNSAALQNSEGDESIEFSKIW